MHFEQTEEFLEQILLVLVLRQLSRGIHHQGFRREPKIQVAGSAFAFGWFIWANFRQLPAAYPFGFA